MGITSFTACASSSAESGKGAGAGGCERWRCMGGAPPGAPREAGRVGMTGGMGGKWWVKGMLAMAGGYRGMPGTCGGRAGYWPGTGKPGIGGAGGRADGAYPGMPGAPAHCAIPASYFRGD